MKNVSIVYCEPCGYKKRADLLKLIEGKGQQLDIKA